MSHTPRRLGALVATSALALSGLALVAAPAQAVTSTPVGDAASWISGELTNGLLHYPDSGFGEFDDHGLSIDVGFSLAAIGGYDATVASISDAMEDAVGADDYITGEAFGDTGSTYANALAKTLVFAQDSGATATSFGGEDLVTRLEAQVLGAGVADGRLFDTSTFGDFANVYGQAFAARGLRAAGSAKAAAVLAYLLQQQCTDGGFKTNLPAQGSPDQTCAGATGGLDPDATATVVLQLRGLQSVPGVTTALGRAKAWLLSVQKPDGSFGGGTSTEAANANSTGLVARALAALGDCVHAARAAAWVRDLQVPPGAVGPLSSEIGAIAYNAEAYQAGVTDGITDATLDQWRRTSAPASASLSLLIDSAPNLDLTGPTWAKGGAVTVYSISGVVPGGKVCATGPGRSKPVLALGDGTAKVAFTMPSTTGARTVTVSDAAASTATVRTRVLGRTTLTVDAPAVVERGISVRVRVGGLYPGESVRITLDGVKVRTGVANSSGVFVGSFRAPTSLGKHVVRAFGKYADIRKGYDILKVVA